MHLKLLLVTLISQIFKWSPGFYLKIQTCFEITDESVLFDSSMDVDFNMSVFTEYFNFSADSCIEEKTNSFISK